ncbi:MAG: hypothetical protein H0T69_02710 [Thermoleophilaceae bacterium]|nr:hypothetical protein [Thermoleophilaceae bacterium]
MRQKRYPARRTATTVTVVRRQALDADAARHVHEGASSQDVMSHAPALR